MSVANPHTTSPGPAPETTGRPRLVPAHRVSATRPPVPVGIMLLGVVAALVAAWGAAAPFAGPDFGFVADRATAWQWSVTSACLGLGPGALACLAALVVVGAATRKSYARRADLWILGLVVALCGAWFVVGQYVWPVIYGTIYIAPSNVNHFMWEELAFTIGPGVILVFCGAVFMGWAVRRQLAHVAERYPRTVEPAGAGVGTVASPRTTTPADGNTGTMAPPVEQRVTQGQVVERPVTQVTQGQGQVVERPVAEPVSQPMGSPGEVPPPPA